MISTLEQALDYLSANPGPSDKLDFLVACTIVADNCAKLPYRVLVYLPDDLEATQWSPVRQASQPANQTGTARLIEPATPPWRYRPGEIIVLWRHETAYIKPVGSPPGSAYVCITVQQGDGDVYLLKFPNPMVKGVNVVFDVATHKDSLGSWAERLSAAGSPIIVGTEGEGKGIPLLAVVTAEPSGPYVALRLDARTERFTPQNRLLVNVEFIGEGSARK